MTCRNGDEQWGDWLCELSREGKRADLNAVPLAFRNAAWAMQIAIEGDFSDHLILGRISAAPDAPTPLAVMDSLGPVPFEGQTLWRMSLTAAQTAALPLAVGGNGVVRFPFMITLVPPVEPAYPLIGGLFTLLGSI